MTLTQSGIYSILNTKNNKQYIGSAVNLSKRKSRHFVTLANGTHHNAHLQNSYTKYGVDAFVFQVLLFVPPEDCIKIEQWFLDDRNPEYNLYPIANSPLGYKHSLKSRRRMSASRIGVPRSNAAKRNLSLAKAGKPGHPQTTETKQKISKALTGHRHTEISRKKMRFAQKNLGDEQKSKRNKRIRTLSSLGLHTRWHTNRELVSDNCKFCEDGI